MTFQWTKNKLDNSLFAEFTKEKPDENIINDLIKKGANINAIDCKGDNVLIDAISNVRDGMDIKFIQLILDLGADINYSEEGFNCLFDACLSCNIELVEMFLMAGVNPNCISSETAESLLDWAEFDQWYSEDCEFEDKQNAVAMKKIVRLLKKYGAKNVSILYAEKPEQFLKVFASYKTGLFTAKGNLKIKSIPNADSELVKTFSNWLKYNPDNWNEYKYMGYKITNPPDLNLLKEHNEQGVLIAKKIKSLVGQDVKVEFYSVNTQDFKKYNVRNVDHTIIK